MSAAIGRIIVMLNNTVRFFLFVFVFSSLFSISLICAHAQTNRQPGLHKPGWTLTFDDEFNESYLDLSRWNITNGPSYINQEQQYYTPDSVKITHGFLRITTRNRGYRGRQYTSGQITTLGKFSQKYGWFEAKIRFPTTVGLWSCVYLLPASGAWPPEIDIAEYLTKTPQELYLTNHWRGIDYRHWQLNSYLSEPNVDFTKWHVYAVDWEKESVQWYMDGRLVATTISSPDPSLPTVTWFVDGRNVGSAPSSSIGPPNSPSVSVSAVPMYIRINDCIGIFGGDAASGPWPQYFDVKYVRAYKRIYEHRH
jgi:beta-glucanase (GH16 family)